MSSTALAYISPEVLRWARQRIGMSQDRLAAALDVPAAQIAALENGLQPSFEMAQHLAEALHIPFGYLFLPKPPSHDVRLPDLRTTSGNIPDRLSPEFINHLTNVLVKHEWYREYQRDRGAPPLAFVGKFTVDSPGDMVAADMRSALNAQEELRDRYETWSQFLSGLTQNAESLGIMVMRSGISGSNTRLKLSVEEFRGFAISDDLAPVVFINSNDAIAAQIFTLAHELVHIWVGASGISNPDFTRKSAQQINAVERFCNHVAAEMLVSTSSFLRLWQPSESIESNVSRLARHYRVSSFVVLRQAFELGEVSEREYWRRFQAARAISAKRPPSGEKRGGGDFYKTLPVRNSRRLTSTVIEAIQERKIALRDAASLLGVKVTALNTVIERVA